MPDVTRGMDPAAIDASPTPQVAGRTARWPLLMAAVLGTAFFVVIAGWRVVSPVHVDWMMQWDWRIHFLGWHIFRGEPWTWPPGRVAGYYAPIGTAIGFTDSIPLLAFALKPLSPLLPMPFQYLGLWLTACFALQGYWGARLAALWTSHGGTQLLAGLLFVLMPTLLNRAIHPALASHWLVIWALVLYLAPPPAPRLPVRSMLAIGAMAGLLHPYLAVMLLAMLTALAVRATVDALAERSAPAAAARPSLALAGTVTLVVSGWWASGLFTADEASMARSGLTLFSMNLLGPIMPSGWSAWLPEITPGTDGQAFEGLQYLGAGVLGLVVAGTMLVRVRPAASSSLRLWPLVTVCAVLGIYALSPRITFADRVVLDYSSPLLDRLAVFGVTGRFFWPAAYLMVALAIRAVVTRLPARTAAAVLALALAAQTADTRPGYIGRYELTHAASFHDFPGKPSSPVWAAALPHYRHLVMVMPAQCGPTPLSYEATGYLAGMHGLTFNGGEMARPDLTAIVQYCVALTERLARGEVDDDSVYLVDPVREPAVRAAAPSLVCGTIDDRRVCVTARSYRAWQDAATFE